MKKSGTVAVLPGDGIGHEVTAQAIRVIDKLNSDFSTGLECTTAPVGGTAYDLHGHPLPPETLELARQSDAVLLCEVGGPQWEKIAREHRPERALLSLRSELQLFSNLRNMVSSPLMLN